MNPDKVTLTPDMSPLAYHEAQLRYAIEKEDNFAQAFHLQEILKLQPWRRELHLRRAFALRNLNRSQESLPHYLSAWMLNSAQPYWPRDDQARKRAEYAVRKQDWLKAAHAYTLVIHQSSSTLSDLQSLSLCQMRAGLKHEAADTISFLINHYGNTGDMTTLGRVVLYGRNVPTNSGSAKRLVQLGERYVAINKSASSLNRFGTILYRAGEYQRAIAVLREAIELHSKDGYVDSWLFLALSLHQAGQWDEAQQWWKKVQRWAKDRKHKSWQTELRWQLWLKEAEQVLDKAPPMPRA